MRKFAKITAGALAAGAAAVSAYAGTPSIKADVPYMKPGANVFLQHNYDGKTSAGEIENIEISIVDGYDAGTLSVTVMPTEGLTLYSDIREHKFSMIGDAPHNLVASVSAATNGVYYLNLHMSASDNAGNVIQRSSGIALYVGTNAKALKRDMLIDASPDVAGEPGLVVMDAEEEIITQD